MISTDSEDDDDDEDEPYDKQKVIALLLFHTLNLS